MTHKGESSGPRPLHMACQLKKKNPNTHAHTRTHSRTHALKSKTKNPVFFNSILHLQQTQTQLFYNASFLNTKDSRLGCIYIYILQWFTVDLFLNILVLLHATVSCI